jgi:RNA polymerase sigma-70 factor (ECF subfamily)
VGEGVVTFEEVYNRFRRPVWALARRLTDTEADALDASQEIFVRIWKGLPGFRGEAKLSTWVFQIAWNFLRAHRRRLGKQPYVVGEGRNDERPVTETIPDTAADPERRLVAVEALDRVDAALRCLPEGQRVVLWLRDGEDLSYDEIARVLDIPIGTVRSRLARARQALRRSMEE